LACPCDDHDNVAVVLGEMRLLVACVSHNLFVSVFQNLENDNLLMMTMLGGWVGSKQIISTTTTATCFCNENKSGMEMKGRFLHHALYAAHFVIALPINLLV
jgi:hypothetical protein